MEKQPIKTPPGREHTYYGKPINERRWFAIVDTDLGKIIRVDSNVGTSRDFLANSIMPLMEHAWRKANPECRGFRVPAEAKESLLKRFIIVDCVVTVSPGEYVWRAS